MSDYSKRVKWCFQDEKKKYISSSQRVMFIFYMDKLGQTKMKTS